ncbi:DUF3343 domain-containing protein [Methanocaldococcus infernus]
MILEKVKSLFSKREDSKEGKGLIIFKSVKDTMKAEKVLKDFNIRVVAPPPEIREGCDLAIEYELVDEIGIKRILKENKIEPLRFISLNDYSLKPLELVKVKYIGNFVMVRCGNMKITLNREGEIVNISGGGCPDVPYLSLKLLGKNIYNSEEPKDIGYSLCAYTLQKAFERAREEVKKLRE